MINLLRRFQVWSHNKFQNFINTRNAILVVMINSAIIASYQENCIDTVIDLRSIGQIIFNSLILVAAIDVRVINFLKLFAAGAVTHMVTAESIGLYMRYIGGLGTRCRLPLYVEGNFNAFVAVSITIGVYYWIFSSNNEDIENVDDYNFPK